MPPTWAVISLIYITYSPNLLFLTFIGVLSSSIGRLILSKSSKAVVPHIFSDYVIGNMNFLGTKVLAGKYKNFLISLLWSLSPIGSNVLFIAAGFSGVKMKHVFFGFIIGRFISYSILAFTSNLIVESLKGIFISDTLDLKQILLQIGGLVILILYLAIDWETLFLRKKLRFNFSILKFRRHAGKL